MGQIISVIYMSVYIHRTYITVIGTIFWRIESNGIAVFKMKFH